MSSLILTSHIRDGIEIAREYKLPPSIIDIIKQHHGTTVMPYFYNKAKEQAGEEAETVREEDYRYPGPKPQTREAAIVMLADAVEAASRTLPDPTPARLEGLVRRIAQSRFMDGQLDECDLTLKDLNEIVKSFVRILMAIHHKRVTYPPEERQERAERRSNGPRDLPGKSPKESEDQPSKGEKENQDNIRHIGLSR